MTGKDLRITYFDRNGAEMYFFFFKCYELSFLRQTTIKAIQLKGLHILSILKTMLLFSFN